MTRIHVPEIDSRLQGFFADPKLPLEITKYDDGEHQEWEVVHPQEATCGYCIAVFTTWREAYDWAYKTAAGARSYRRHPPPLELLLPPGRHLGWVRVLGADKGGSMSKDESFWMIDGPHVQGWGERWDVLCTTGKFYTAYSGADAFTLCNILNGVGVEAS